MRNKFVYSCSIKIHSSGFDRLLGSIFCLLLVVEVFSLPSKLLRCLKKWYQLARGQVNMVDEAKLCSPIRSTFEVLVVWRVVQHCHAEEPGPSCWPAAGVAVFRASHQSAEHVSQMWSFHRDSESCSGSDWQQTTSDHDRFWVQDWLWEVLWSFYSA